MSKLPNHSELLDMHKLSIDSYTGVGGFYDKTYLNKFKAEEDSDFQDRFDNVSYQNQIKGIIDSITKPVWANEITRTGASNYEEAFINDATGNGTSLSQFLEETGTYHNISDNVFIIMDNFNVTGENEQEDLENRLFPFVYFKTYDEVHSYELDVFGNVLEISFEYRTIEVEGNTKIVYRHIDAAEQYDYYLEDKVKIQVSVPVPHSIGVPPVIMTGNKVANIPPIFSLASLAKVGYNQFSELRNLEVRQGFSILVLPGIDNNTSTEIGAGCILGVPDHINQSPAYIAPDSNISKTIMESIEKTMQTITEMGKQQGAIPVMDSSKSGAAYSYEFVGASFQLTSLGKLYQNDVEVRIFNLFNKFLGNDSSTIEISYDMNYTPGKTQLEESNKYLIQAMGLHISETANKEYTKAYVSNVNNLAQIVMDDKTLRTIAAEIDASMPKAPEEEKTEN